MKFVIILVLATFIQQSYSNPLKNLFGIGIEKPSYEIVKKIDGNSEVRKYSPSKWVSASVQSEAKNMQSSTSPMFRALYNYISGSNDARMKMDMTAPVTFVMKPLGDASKPIDFDTKCDVSMRFFISKNHQANTPKPIGDLKLEDDAETTYAVIRFGGYAKMSDYLKYRDELVQKLGNEAKNYDAVNILLAGYDAPFKFFDRTNEVWLKKKF